MDFVYKGIRMPWGLIRRQGGFSCSQPGQPGTLLEGMERGLGRSRSSAGRSRGSSGTEWEFALGSAENGELMVGREKSCLLLGDTKETDSDLGKHGNEWKRHSALLGGEFMEVFCTPLVLEETKKFKN